MGYLGVGSRIIRIWHQCGCNHIWTGIPTCTYLSHSLTTISTIFPYLSSSLVTRVWLTWLHGALSLPQPLTWIDTPPELSSFPWETPPVHNRAPTAHECKQTTCKHPDNSIYPPLEIIRLISNPLSQNFILLWQLLQLWGNQQQQCIWWQWLCQQIWWCGMRPSSLWTRWPLLQPQANPLQPWPLQSSTNPLWTLPW